MTARWPAAGALALLLASWTSPAAGEPCESSWGLGKGNRAPCRGLLVPHGEARQALDCLAVRLPRARADLDFCRSRADANDASAREMLRAAEDHRVLLETRLQEALLVAPRPWWDAPGTWFGGGVAVGAALVTGIVYGIKAL